MTTPKHCSILLTFTCLCVTASVICICFVELETSLVVPLRDTTKLFGSFFTFFMGYFVTRACLLMASWDGLGVQQVYPAAPVSAARLAARPGVRPVY